MKQPSSSNFYASVPEAFFLRKIEFWYDTKGVRDGRANVTVYGMR